MSLLSSSVSSSFLGLTHVTHARMRSVLALIQVVVEPMKVVLDLLIVQHLLVNVIVDVKAEGPNLLRLSLRDGFRIYVLGCRHACLLVDSSTRSQCGVGTRSWSLSEHAHACRLQHVLAFRALSHRS